MAPDLVSAANGNLRHAFATLAEEARGGECRRFGSLTAAAAGVPVPLFNRLFVFDTPSSDELSGAVEWLSNRDVPFYVTVTESVLNDVTNRLESLDLVEAGEQPGMAMVSLDELPPRDPVVDISEVTDPDGREAFSTVTATAFELPRDVAARIDRAGLAAADVRMFLGSVDGRPAATGVLIRSGDVAGVYSIGVVERFRRRGLGETMSWEVLRAGREAGCSVGVLQSSEMGYPLYKRMGFETVVSYHQFEPAD